MSIEFKNLENVVNRVYQDNVNYKFSGAYEESHKYKSMVKNVKKKSRTEQ